VADDGTVRVQERALEDGEYELSLKPREGLDGLVIQALPSNDAVVALDARTTPELEQEGMARDVVRLIQIARKEADLDVSDKIDLALECVASTRAAVEAHRAYVLEQTLASTLAFGVADADMHAHHGKLGEVEVTAGVRRA
jgi:isoleucyl-tRNA synthetase